MVYNKIVKTFNKEHAIYVQAHDMYNSKPFLVYNRSNKNEVINVNITLLIVPIIDIIGRVKRIIKGCLFLENLCYITIQL